MSRKKKRERSSAMPSSSAGLIRFFQDEAYGIKVRPEYVIVGSVMLILTVILARVFFP